MAGYLHTLDNQYDDLALHCTSLTSRVESLEQKVRELSEEKASLQESLSMAEGEEANTREAYRTLKLDYDKKLKKLAPARKTKVKDVRLSRRKKILQETHPTPKRCPWPALMTFSRNLGTP
jgi:chromosome segregation ATPase